MRDLYQTFNDLQKTYPAIVRRAKPIGIGVYGIITDNGDGTVSKTLFRQGTIKSRETAENMAHNELTVLRMINKTDFDDIETPILVDDIRPLNSSQFFATYRMTKISGKEVNWPLVLESKSNIEKQSHFLQLGKLMAQFHKVAANFNEAKLTPHNLKWGGRVQQLPDVDEDINCALTIANDYLQNNSTPAIIHGDIHQANIMIDSKSNITGILDFGCTGHNQNYLSDFRCAPSSMFPYIIKGYEQESDKTIDPLMVHITELGFYVDWLNDCWNDDIVRVNGIIEIKKQLSKIRSLTGFTPKPA